MKTEIERIWANGKNVIFDIDVAGGLRIKKKFPEETLAVFCKTTQVSMTKIETKKRSTESEDKINMRIAKASVRTWLLRLNLTKSLKLRLGYRKEEAYQLVKICPRL